MGTNIPINTNTESHHYLIRIYSLYWYRLYIGIYYMRMELNAHVEAILFWKGEPIEVAELARMLSADISKVEAGLAELERSLAVRGVRLMRAGDTVALATAPEASELIARLRREELEGELGRAALQTLSIILYRTPVSRRDIEYIRGVNSTFILRNLLVRGLVERAINTQDERVFLYRPTLALFSLLGVARAEELPEYAAVRAEMAAFEASATEDEERESK